MKRLLVVTVVLAILFAACTSATSEPDPTDSPAPSTTTHADVTAPPTTAPPLATPSTVEPRAGLEAAKALMTQPELAEGGVLDANGAFAETTEGFTPFEDLELYSYVDENGESVVFYVEGSTDLIRELVIEFDAQDSAGAVVVDTSYVGDLVTDPPPWAAEAQNGNTVNAEDYPPPALSASSGGLGLRVSLVKPLQASSDQRLGARIYSDITLDEFALISMWLYLRLQDGTMSFAHYQVTQTRLVERMSDGFTVALFFSDLFGPELPPLIWVDPRG